MVMTWFVLAFCVADFDLSLWSMSMLEHSQLDCSPVVGATTSSIRIKELPSRHNPASLDMGGITQKLQSPHLRFRGTQTEMVSRKKRQHTTKVWTRDYLQKGCSTECTTPRHQDRKQALHKWRTHNNKQWVEGALLRGGQKQGACAVQP